MSFNANLSPGAAAAYLQKLTAKLSFDPSQLGFGAAALLAALVLDPHHLIQRRNQRLVRMLQRLDIHDAALGLAGRLDRRRLLDICIFLFMPFKWNIL